jgi:predicted metal-dependent hydrolase
VKTLAVQYGTEVTDCIVTETKRLTEKIRIHVHPDGLVEIEAPQGVEPAKLQAAAQRRARWIFINRASFKAARADALPREYTGGETHFYLGRRYRLHIRQTRAEPAGVKLKGGRLEVTTARTEPAAIRRRLKQWYREHAEPYFQRRLEMCAPSLPWIQTLPETKLVAMERQWGSCTPDGRIHLNPALIKAPPHCIDYVLIHEACHLVEHNHSKRFYVLLDRHCPDWRATKLELDRLAELLLADRPSVSDKRGLAEC